MGTLSIVLSLVMIVMFIGLIAQDSKISTLKKALQKRDEKLGKLQRKYNELKEVSLLSIEVEGRTSKKFKDFRQSYLKNPTEDHLLSILHRITRLKTLYLISDSEEERDSLEAYYDSLEKSAEEFYKEKK